MPQVGNKYSVRQFVEVGGVQTQMQTFWELTAINGTPAIGDALADLANALWDPVKAQVSNVAMLSCLLWEGLDDNDCSRVFPSIPGDNVSDSHPPQGIVTLNLWGVRAGGPPNVNVRNSINLSGVAESLSVRGRLIDGSDWVPWETLYRQSVTTDPAQGFVLAPLVRWDQTPKPAPARSYAYVDTVDASLSSERISTMNSRKVKLCGAG